MISPAYESFVNDVCVDIANESITFDNIKKVINEIIDKLISTIKAFKQRIIKLINRICDKFGSPIDKSSEPNENSSESNEKTYTLVNYKSLVYLECSNDMLDDIKLRVNSISIMDDYMNASAQANNIKNMIKSVQANSFDSGAWSKEVSDKFNFYYTNTDNMYIDNSKLKSILNKRARVFTNKANLYCITLKRNIDQRIDQVMKHEPQRYKRVDLMAYTSKMVEDTSNLIQLIISKIESEIKNIIKMNVTDISEYKEYKPL